jgi:hypothetical protein
VAETTPLSFNQVNPEDFNIASLDDEIRVDTLCGRLLLAVRDQILARRNRTPLEVGELCHGADLFLRDFVIAACGDNPLRLPPERIRQFAGHWYIINTLEPNAGDLAVILSGVADCYAILAEHGLVDAELAQAAAAAGRELPWYRQRIDDYWAIEADGYAAWRAACPLPHRRL